MRKHMRRTITKYHYKIIDTNTDEVLKEETVFSKVTKDDLIKDFINKNGYAPIRIELNKVKTKHKMLVKKFIELSEEVEEF